MTESRPAALPAFNLRDPRWITAFIAAAIFVGSVFMSILNLDGWRQKTDRQIELLTYLACRNEASIHPGVPILECERFWKTNAEGKVEIKP
jgi:hypothetical protein